VCLGETAKYQKRKIGEMMKKLLGMTALFALTFILTACQSPINQANFFETYRNSYVGDNSAVGNIAHNLDWNEQLESIELSTAHEPFGIQLNLGQMPQSKLLVENASYLFALVPNAEWLRFSNNEEEFQIERSNLESWLGVKLTEITSQENLQNLLAKHKLAEFPLSRRSNETTNR
jgi:hypothetical protein